MTLLRGREERLWTREGGLVSRVRGRGLVPGTHGKGGAGVHALADGIGPVCKTHTVLLERTAHTGFARTHNLLFMEGSTPALDVRNMKHVPSP